MLSVIQVQCFISTSKTSCMRVRGLSQRGAAIRVVMLRLSNNVAVGAERETGASKVDPDLKDLVEPTTRGDPEAQLRGLDL
jgi:hypothetical protein